MLFADDLCLMSNDPKHKQTMLNKLKRMHEEVSHCQFIKV